MVAGIGSVLDDLAEANRRGTGVPYTRFGPHLRNGQGSINRPTYHTSLRDWLDATGVGKRILPDEQFTLGADSRISGCGCGENSGRSSGGVCFVRVARSESSPRTGIARRIG